MDVRRRLEIASTHAPPETEMECSDSAEMVSYQLRRILETIAFSALAANKELYETHHGDFDKHWKAAKILNKLEAIHPDFYPKPLEYISPGNYRIKNAESLSKQRFTSLYDITSEVLHTWNPYRIEPHGLDIKRPFQEWIELIYCLMDVHQISIPHLGITYICHLNHPLSGKTTLYVTQPNI